jgi:hypothetical protein
MPVNRVHVNSQVDRPKTEFRSGGVDHSLGEPNIMT